jgi:hypothetical protein
MLVLGRVAHITTVYLLFVVCFLVPRVEPVPLSSDEIMDSPLLSAVGNPLELTESFLQEKVVLQAPSSSGGFPTWLLAPIILGGFAVLAATFVGVRWVQFKQRRNQKKLPTQHKRIVDARVAGLLEKGGDVSGLLSISKDLAPADGQNEQDFAKLGHGHIPDFGHVFEEKRFSRNNNSRCRVCAQAVVGPNVQCSLCRGNSHAHCLGGINFQCKPGEPDPSYLIVAEDEEEPDLPEDGEMLNKLYDELLLQLNIPPERFASMQALPLDHKKTLLRQQIKQGRRSTVSQL